LVLKAVAAFAAAAATALCAACAPSTAPVLRAPDASLVGPHGEPVALRRAAEGARLTVLVFFSTQCHCLDVHEGRIRALAGAYGPRGVSFAMIDSEVGASPARDDAEAVRRGYPFPIWVDRGARLAGALGARYATYAVVLDAKGGILYRGGLDSDRTHLTTDATPYLKNAIDDALDGRPPRLAEGEALGCSLQTW
jgi:hypothetical protein